MTIDLNNAQYYFNRELSWLKFNLRVLKEGGVKTTPLMERLKFVAISASNLDEFFMVRVAGLYNQFENGINKKDGAGLSVEDQLNSISRYSHTQMRLKYRFFFSLLKELRSSIISMLFWVSRLPVGSSAKSTRGFVTMARAIATLCCCPPESCAGVWWATCSSPTLLSASIAI